MGNQGSSGDGVRFMQEWYNAGLIGDATAIHIWTNRPVWPQGGPKPAAQDEIPKELNWDLWQGPAAADKYPPKHLPFNWLGTLVCSNRAVGLEGRNLDAAHSNT